VCATSVVLLTGVARFHLTTSELLHTSEILAIVSPDTDQVVAVVAVEPSLVVPLGPHVVVDTVSELLGNVVGVTTSRLFQLTEPVTMLGMGSRSHETSDEVAVVARGPTFPIKRAPPVLCTTTLCGRTDSLCTPNLLDVMDSVLPSVAAPVHAGDVVAVWTFRPAVFVEGVPPVGFTGLWGVGEGCGGETEEQEDHRQQHRWW